MARSHPHSICVCVCVQIRNQTKLPQACDNKVKHVRGKVALKLVTNQSEAAHGRRATLYNHNTAVQMREGDALNAAVQRARKHVTPHGSLFVDKPNSSAGWENNAGETGRRCGSHLPFLASCLAEKFWGATSSAANKLR